MNAPMTKFAIMRANREKQRRATSKSEAGPIYAGWPFFEWFEDAVAYQAASKAFDELYPEGKGFTKEDIWRLMQ